MRVRLLLCYAWIVNLLRRSASPGRYLTINSIDAIQSRALYAKRLFINNNVAS